MDVVGSLAAISQVLSISKELKEIDKGLSEAELKLRIAELMSAAADVKMSLVEVQGEIEEKDKEISRLTEMLEERPNLVDKYGYIFKANEKGEPTGTPYCQRCYDTEKKLYRTMDLVVGDVYEKGCPVCKTLYPRAPEFA